MTFVEIIRRAEKWSPRQCTDGLKPAVRRDFRNV